MAFENTKASFVAGIVVIITMLNDTIDVIFAMGAIISAVVRLICFMNRTLTERRNRDSLTRNTGAIPAK